MASARHRPLPRPSSSSRNPFDSFDDENDASKGTPSMRFYQNPFDDEDGHGDAFNGKPNHALRSPPSRSKPSFQANAKNPFDDNDEQEEKEEDTRYSKKQGNLKDKLDQGTLFDEEPRFHGDLDIQECKSKIKFSATSALEKVQKMKDAGTAQVSRMLEGGIHQAQRLKEGSFNAFKFVEDKANQSGQERNQPRINNALLTTFQKDALAGRLANLDASEHTQSQLFTHAAHRSAYDKGRLAVDDDRHLGLNETGSLGTRSHTQVLGYALQKSEDTTKCLQNCLQVAEEMKGNATHTLVSLHQQGEQLRQTYEVAHDMDQSLTRGEKLLGSLGGIFSRTWKPKRCPAIKGPVDDPKDFQMKRKGHHLEQQSGSGIDSKSRTDRIFDVCDSQVQSTDAKLKVERTKQDVSLSDLSNVLDQLKERSIDMGAEISRQNVALDNFQNDVGILDERMKGANVRVQHLLRR